MTVNITINQQFNNTYNAYYQTANALHVEERKLREQCFRRSVNGVAGKDIKDFLEEVVIREEGNYLKVRQIVGVFLGLGEEDVIIQTGYYKEAKKKITEFFGENFGASRVRKEIPSKVTAGLISVECILDLHSRAIVIK